MTADPVRQLAQANPVPNLGEQWIESVLAARRQVEALTAQLRALDNLRDLLDEHQITVAVDLGPIGNAAAAARRDLEKQKPGPTFRMPAGA